MTYEQRQLNEQVARNLGYSHFTIDAPAGWYAHRPGEKKLSALPNFCADPAAADLVRLEIERRGGEIDTYNRQRGEVRHRGADVRFGLGQWHRGESDSPHMALCLAFLAACEAKAEEGGEG